MLTSTEITNHTHSYQTQSKTALVDGIMESNPDCNKAYGTLDHLNAHARMQKHGSIETRTRAPVRSKDWYYRLKERKGPCAYSSPFWSFYEDIAQLVSSSVSPANSPDTVDDDLSSPGLSPTNPSPIYYYVDRVGSSFGSPSSPTEMYDTDPPSAYPASSSNNIYQRPLPTPQNTCSFSTVSDIRESDEPAYPSDSASGDVHSSADFSHSYPESHSQHPHISSYHTDARSPSTQPAVSRDSYIETPSASALPSSLLGQRHMSEPAILAVPSAYSTTSGADTTRYSYPMAYSNSSRSSYAPSLQRGTSIGSLRDLRHQHQQLHYSSSRSPTGWKTEEDSYHMAHGTHASEGSYQTDAGWRYNPSTQPTLSRDSYIETISTDNLGKRLRTEKSPSPQRKRRRQRSQRGSFVANPGGSESPKAPIVPLTLPPLDSHHIPREENTLVNLELDSPRLGSEGGYDTTRSQETLVGPTYDDSSDLRDFPGTNVAPRKPVGGLSWSNPYLWSVWQEYRERQSAAQSEEFV
ncbi:hypothetical protein BT96DRAFT_416376 [Gymnopus androsaceus JB14]|uniref:C2H2-type domain-containing protein n=1 Tax=Gymnopus androsaceus JB14 TaxID=1447944 RepID=A0A6A4GUC0_9AGAR|nr:hypothetical protein BT96DRAFT_416376 [Gymnopus androsaceus JB14]